MVVTEQVIKNLRYGHKYIKPRIKKSYQTVAQFLFFVKRLLFFAFSLNSC
jgi:hypothetical protein